MERKSLYDISWKVSEKEYREDPAYSYSVISKFNKEGFNNLSSLYDKVESPSLIFGSAVDILITEGEEAFNSKFEIAEFPNISDTLIQVTNKLFDKYSNIYRSINFIPDEEISQIGIKCGYYANPKYNTYRIKKIREECAIYYNLLFISKDKILINTEEYNHIMRCVDTLKNSYNTKDYFSPNNPFDDSIEKHYQLKFKGVFNNIPIRCMAD